MVNLQWVGQSLSCCLKVLGRGSYSVYLVQVRYQCDVSKSLTNMQEAKK